MGTQSNRASLINSADSVLIVIDVQDVFLDKLPEAHHQKLLNNICWLIEVAQWCKVPLIVTAEEMPVFPVAGAVLGLISAETPIYNKLTFGLAHQPNILAAVEQTGRKTAILIGLETDVCVLHSAIGLLEQGYRVAVVTDATGTPAPNHALAIERMSQIGVLILNMKGLFYEWLRDVQTVTRFHNEMPHMRERAQIIL